MPSWPHSSSLALALLAILSCSENKPTPTPKPTPTDPTDMTDPKPTARPFEVGFSVNHDGTQRVLRGWPLVVRISATLATNTDEAYRLDDDTLTVRVRDEGGGAEEWPFVSPPAEAATRALDTKAPTLDVVRLLDATTTAKLARGPRTVEVKWGPATERFAITVADAPKNDADARALLLADESLQLGDVDAALEALDERLDEDPRSVALLNQRALVHEQAGDAISAFVDAQAALAAFVQQYPNATEPPVTILQLTGRLDQRMMDEAEGE
jgi:hypothetical protein